MSENRRKFYHLSNSPTPTADSGETLLVTLVGYIFNHWKSGLKYLHEVEIDGRVVDYQEQGHHDMVSNFTTDEAWFCTSIKVVNSWALDDIAGLTRLVESGVVEQMEAGLFTRSIKFYGAIIELATPEVIPQLVSMFNLVDAEKLRSLRFHNKKAFSKLLDAIKLNETHLEALIDLSLFSNRVILDQSSRTCIERHIRSLDEIQTPKLRQSLSEVIVEGQLDEIALGSQPIELSSQWAETLVREKKTQRLVELLDEHSNLKLSCTQSVVNLATLYQQWSLLDWLMLHNTSANAQRWVQTIQLSAFGDCNGYPLAQLCTDEELLSWQEKQADNLLDASRLGLSLLVQSLLERQDYTQQALDNALVEASQYGFTQIVKMLAQTGGSLEAEGYFPMKYAMRHGYDSLRLYLLESGQIERRFR
ncbi:ankyrin repeat domain-containing protein [Vibrio sp. SCSIO 43136]|uniref:ankyrin repeat domain-containing protein n=1 Tax=Vibrio sp. SCSIO 43136 TaxID=2819101 RepID=UPI00207548F3|nr:ankyrin repeat domain-containing protein [Vibrio sp. SCSIO 43136]USD66958.1 hypothetical protein J4N39_20150 [Vibrio sp. SCSIO 43136]